MRDNTKKTSISGLLGLLLLGVFAICILSVLLTGADAYRRLTARDQQAYARRTCTQYLTTKVRQAQLSGMITVEKFGDGDALLFPLDMDGEIYTTRIYCYEGWLMELFAFEEGELSPADGERVLQAQGLELSVEDGVLWVTLTDENADSTQLALALRGGEGRT